MREVLDYVEFDADTLIRKLRETVEAAVRDGRVQVHGEVVRGPEHHADREEAEDGIDAIALQQRHQHAAWPASGCSSQPVPHSRPSHA